MQQRFDVTRYSTIVCVDTMVALEAKPLAALPWQEIDPAGPVLLLVVPQVAREVDKRKRDGRLGKKAREFNRLIMPAAESGEVAPVVSGVPSVDIGLAVVPRINWDALPDLDPDDPDTRIIAEILHAPGLPPPQLTFLSNDINPIAIASRLGLRCVKMPEAWLMEPEPSPQEKEVQRLKGRVRELETSEPDLRFDLVFQHDPPVRAYRIEELNAGQKRAITDHLLRTNFPNDGQPRLPGYATFDGHQRAYRDVALPRYAAVVHRMFETDFNQFGFTLSLENAGSVQAEDLVMAVEATGGTLHDRFVQYPIFGPPVPRQDSFSVFDRHFLDFDIEPRPGKHDMNFAVGPNCSATIEIQCGDFRHGRQWTFEGILTIDPRAASPFSIRITVTASNMRGERRGVFDLPFEVRPASLTELVALAEQRYLVRPPLAERAAAEAGRENSRWFEFRKLDKLK